MSRNAVRGALAAGVLALVSVGCSGATKIDARLAPDAVLAGKRTYVLVVAPEGEGERTPAIIEFLEKRIAPEVRRGMESRGYKAEGEGADLKVVIHASQTGKVSTTRWGYSTVGWDMWGPWYGVGVVANSQDYKKAAVVCDVADPKTQTLLYRSFVEGFVGLRGEMDQQQIREAVEKMLAKLPRAS